MHKRGAHVVVEMDTVVVRMPVPCMAVTMMVSVVVAKHPGADEIDTQAEHSDQNGLVERDRNWIEQPLDAFVGDHQRDEREHDRTAECSEIAELSSAEGEPPIAGVASRKSVGECGNQQRA